MFHESKVLDNDDAKKLVEKFVKDDYPHANAALSYQATRNGWDTEKVSQRIFE